MLNNTKLVIFTLISTSLFLASDYLITSEISLFSSIFFLMLILYLGIFFKKSLYFYLSFSLLGLIHHIFFSYFQRYLTSADIYNFFTHIHETFETLFVLWSLFVIPIIIFFTIIIILWLLNKITIQKYILKPWIKYPLLGLLLFINLNSTMGLKLLDSLLALQSTTNSDLVHLESPLYPKREVNTTIILILGESMKYNSYVEQKLKTQGHFYKKIYAGATNTDISLPLLLNKKNNTLQLSPKNQTNLFRLAKKSNFNTAFISIQSEKSLHYIKPYLQLSFVDTYKSFEKKSIKPMYDLLLLDELKKIDLSKKSFIVLQQIGQHSPYHYFKGQKSDHNSKNYQKSVDYSFEFYHSLFLYLKNMQQPFILIYTSDHGEFSGEDGRYGHNSFDPVIYEVPMFITSNSIMPPNYQQINSHYELSQFLIYLLGFEKELIFDNKKTIINGTMLTREDGFIVID